MGQATGSVNGVMVVPAVMPMVVLEVMDSTVDFDSVVEIVRIASVAVALKSIEALAVPLHLAGCAAFDSYLIVSYEKEEWKKTNKPYAQLEFSWCHSDSFSKKKHL